MIDPKDIELVRESLDMARQAGAEKARATLCRSEEDLVATLNGEVDRVTHCVDSSLSFALFADGRFGSFSTNKLDPASLRDFLESSVKTVRTISKDECRDLPDPRRCCSKAITGDELGLTDCRRESMTPEERIRMALDASVYRDGILSEEGEYSDSIYKTVVMDTDGVLCLHSETSFDYGVEITIEEDGEKYSGYWWDSASHLDALDARSCGEKALARSRAQVGSDAVPGGRYNMVVDSEVASKMVSPVLRALNAFSIQQNNSFLVDSLGKRPFPEGLTIMDLPHIKGQTCSKLFDSEGVATVETPIIRSGEVCEYFVNTYMSRKLGIAPTVEEATRPKVLPWPESGLGRSEILKICGNGILVTDFNGGNSNPVTGDFSYGIEGFLFENGKVSRPVSGMLVTGNFLSLWKKLIAAGDDARDCMSKLIPTLAFADVDFSG